MCSNILIFDTFKTEEKWNTYPGKIEHENSENEIIIFEQKKLFVYFPMPIKNIFLIDVFQKSYFNIIIRHQSINDFLGE